MDDDELVAFPCGKLGGEAVVALNKLGGNEASVRSKQRKVKDGVALEEKVKAVDARDLGGVAVEILLGVQLGAVGIELPAREVGLCLGCADP